LSSRSPGRHFSHSRTNRFHSGMACALRIVADTGISFGARGTLSSFGRPLVAGGCPCGRLRPCRPKPGSPRRSCRRASGEGRDPCCLRPGAARGQCIGSGCRRVRGWRGRTASGASWAPWHNWPNPGRGVGTTCWTTFGRAAPSKGSITQNVPGWRRCILARPKWWSAPVTLRVPRLHDGNRIMPGAVSFSSGDWLLARHSPTALS
jgi:hypothetical protein